MSISEKRHHTRPLRVCIDARLDSGTAGGIEQVVIGLAEGLSRLEDGDEEYLFLTNEGRDGWIAPHVHGRSRLLHRAATVRRVRQRLSSVPGVVWAYTKLLEFAPPRVPRSDGTVERAGVDVMHFTSQWAFLTGIPSIYHPHDLQHVHLPEFFADRERRRRDVFYRTFSEQATVVAVTSSWVKRDVVAHFRLAPDKVQVVPWAPVVSSYSQPTPGDMEAIRCKHALPDAFAFFPAQTWPHKNHLGLVRAVARVRDRHGVTVPVVCSGRVTEHHRAIMAEAQRVGIADTLRFTGFVTPTELQALYRLARLVVIPTLFEAASFPLWEAFENGVAAACSSVTSLPEQAGDAALVFDPHDPDAMAAAIFSLWTDERLRRTLVERGRERVARFTWERTARTFRAHYRRIAGRPLTDEDLRFLGIEAEL